MAATTAQAPAPAPAPAPRLHERIGRDAIAVIIALAVVMLIVAALATSRADNHVLTARGLAAIVAGAALTLAIIGFPNGIYTGAHDLLDGTVALDCEPGCWAEPSGDRWAPRTLWRDAVMWSTLVALWAGAGAALVAVALNGRRATVWVAFVALAGLTATGAVAVNAVARHRGAHAARAVLAGTVAAPAAVGLRRRGWLHLAVPIAIVQFVVNGAATWMLFHDYRVLTGKVVLADVLVLVVLVTVVFATTTNVWGNTDARLGRAVLDEPDTQRVPAKAAVGVQAMVYVVVIGLIAAKVVGYVLPSHPTLLQAGLARGAIGGLTAFLAAGGGYVRGAVNARMGEDL